MAWAIAALGGFVMLLGGTSVGWELACGRYGVALVGLLGTIVGCVVEALGEDLLTPVL